MSRRIRGIVVTHGALAQALLEAVDCIVGPGHGLVAVSNEGCGAESLDERIAAVLNGDPAVLFVDMPGGSCFMAAARMLQHRDDVYVVGGVNLPMLLDFVQQRDDDIDAVVRHLCASGAKSIRVMPS